MSRFARFVFAQVLLVGILGEDHIICSDAEDPGELRGRMCSFYLLFTAAAVLIFMCIILLTNEAAQTMAPGDHHVGAVVGITVCVLAPLSLVAWQRHRKRKMLRLAKKCTLGAKSDLPTRG